MTRPNSPVLRGSRNVLKHIGAPIRDVLSRTGEHVRRPSFPERINPLRLERIEVREDGVVGQGRYVV